MSVMEHHSESISTRASHRFIKPVFHSLRVKIVTLFAIATLFPLAVAGTLAYRRSYEALLKITTDGAAQIGIQVNKNFDLRFLEGESFLKIADHPATIQFLKPDGQTEDRIYRTALELNELFSFFRQVFDLGIRLEDIYILGLNGNNISQRYGRFTSPADFGSLTVVQRTLENPGEVFFLFQERVNHAPRATYGDVISISRAILRPVTREVLGVIVVDVKGDSFRALTRDIRLGNTGYFSVITPDKQYIYPPGKSYKEDEVSNETARKIAFTETGATIDSTSGVPELFVFNTVRRSKWKIVGRVRLSEVMESANGIRRLTAFAVFFGLIFIVIAFIFISDAITRPLRRLRMTMKEAESGNLDVSACYTGTDEVADLYSGFNTMILKIKDLMHRSLEEHENAKKFELQALQAQINPHFLYNTLDAIVWMSEGYGNGEVVKLTRALSGFFRIALSKGHDWITIKQEKELISNYLVIQKIRHRELLEYTVAIDEDIMDCHILKLVLQPLVENAIIHGIRNKRRGGLVTLRGFREDAGIVLQVIDTGGGISTDKLAQITARLKTDEIDSSDNHGYGLMNVNQRIRLYYGPDCGLTLLSTQGTGTTVSLKLPVLRREDVDV